MKRVDVVYACLFNEEGNKVLMVKNAGRETWSLPGGAVECGETLQQAVIREVKEETGFTIEVGNIIAVNEKFFSNLDEHAIILTFAATIIGGEEHIQYKDEILEISWIDIHRADELMPVYPSGIASLKANSTPYTYQN
jgi:8-oxo-dGTP diphosphatase